MNELFKLYYYELIKNKNKFIVLVGISLAIILFSIVFTYGQENKYMIFSEVENIVKISQNSKDINSAFLNEFLDASKLTFENYLGFKSKILMELFLITAIAMSFDVVTRNYKKKSNSFYIDTNLPVSIYKIKFSRLLVSISIYVVASLILMTMILSVNYVLSVMFNTVYKADLRYVLDAFTLPSLVKLTFMYPISTVSIYISGCIMIIQSLASIIFIDKGKNIIIKKITYFILIAFLIIFMLFFLLVGDINPTYMNSKLVVFNIVFLSVSISLFLVDCKLTEKRLREVA
ncbi:hypothetical protein [Peptostreptococcus faecalis]|uniref:hypothetical protein n=1 Tax=Peptostreptococcus faecalis TaxID=2045015 RepID=UPI000C7B7174|nr:hypothetical protein [Peptostreptococcus faecalis]